MRAKQTTSNNSFIQNLIGGVWLFPAVLTALLILLTLLKISGSSIGIYHPYFYGNSSKDHSLLLNRPRPIRSDEWLVNTQMTIAQKNLGYPKINKNIGHGEDTTIILDVPSKDWSTLFKPQNLAFFILPFEYAFAFKWWLMAYLLILSCYFFVLYLMPNRRLLASLVALGLFFSPFIQWWYQYITLGSIYYSLFLALAFVYLLQAKTARRTVWLGLTSAYLLVCFALVQYPPFQIACGVAVLSFLAGNLIERRHLLHRPDIRFKTIVIALSIFVSGLVVFGFLKSNQAAYDITKNTAYPGHRNILSGGFDENRLLTSNLAFQFQFTGKALKYYFPARGDANQSETSNFIYLMPFLVLPELALLARSYRLKKALGWPLLVTLGLFCIFMIRMLTPFFNPFFKLILFNQILTNRLIIGIGLLGIINLALLMRFLKKAQGDPFKTVPAAAYAAVVFLIEILSGVHMQHLSPGFVTTGRLLLLALPIPVIIYLLLRRRYSWAAFVLLCFSVLSSAAVNPLYRGTAVLTDSALPTAIKRIAASNNGRWIAQGTMLQNIPALSGVNSLSGVYTYPQLDIWNKIDLSGAQKDVYNRFAHIEFAFDDRPKNVVPTILLRGGDNILITTGQCNNFLAGQNVRFILAEKPLPQAPSCSKLVETVNYPASTFYIYQVI